VIKGMVSSQSRTKITNLCGVLKNTTKNDLSVEKYFAKMKDLASKLAATGKPLGDDELMVYTVNGLDGSYTSLVASVNAVPDTTLTYLFDQLTSFDDHEEMQSENGQGNDTFMSSTNIVLSERAELGEWWPMAREER
jgi:hypothetical protein